MCLVCKPTGEDGNEVREEVVAYSRTVVDGVLGKIGIKVGVLRRIPFISGRSLGIFGDFCRFF